MILQIVLAILSFTLVLAGTPTAFTNGIPLTNGLRSYCGVSTGPVISICRKPASTAASTESIGFTSPTPTPTPRFSGFSFTFVNVEALFCRILTKSKSRFCYHGSTENVLITTSDSPSFTKETWDNTYKPWIT